MIEIKQNPDQAQKAAAVTGKDQEPCYVCGRAINTSGKSYYWIEVTGGGRYVETRAALDSEDPGYTGSYPVGGGCVRKAGLKGYAARAC